MFGSKLIPVTEKNMIRMCLFVLLLDQDYNSGRCMPTVTTPTRASCDAKCTYSEATREANCEHRQLSEAPMECNDASYLSLRHNRIERIESGTFAGFSKLQFLILSSNKIRQVEANAFSGASKLKQIDLQSNNLETFDRLALNGSGELRRIKLSHNNIKDIEIGTFQVVIKLEFIALNNNSLSSLDPGVFDNLSHLNVLDLGWNKLMVLHSDIFAPLSQLQTLILSDNQLISTGRVLLLPQIRTLDMRNDNLTRLENLSEEVLGRLGVFLLEGNPWICDCQLEPLRLWYSRLQSQGQPIVYVDSPTCFEPPSLAMQPINGVREGFCQTSFLSSTADPSKSTKESCTSDEINNLISPDVSEPNSSGKSFVKIIVPVLIILAVTLVCVSCVLKYKCNWKCNSHDLPPNTADYRQSRLATSESGQLANENTPMINHSGNGQRSEDDRHVAKPDTEQLVHETMDPRVHGETNQMLNTSVEGTPFDPVGEQQVNETTPPKQVFQVPHLKLESPENTVCGTP
ncbi:uncharacterized protein [Diadema setosum]|uniref:uncharacterized protein n=1 Tax=Diadema setosum TaxID=31175 RepID=UPI003B3A9CCA